MRALAAVILVVLVAGCLSGQAKDRVLYFYDPACPNCAAVEPFISYLEQKYGVKVRKINLDDPANAYLADKWHVDAVPTLIILTDNGTALRYVGRVAVVEAEGEVAKIAGMPPPERPYNIQQQPIDPMSCLLCHAKRNISPPSTYSCSSCCHGGSSPKDL